MPPIPSSPHSARRASPGEKAKDVVEEAYCSTVLCLLGNKAMEEQRTIIFPDYYKIPYMKF